MGEIEIEVVRSEAGRMQIAMTTESASVLNMLRQDREQLLDALQSRGISAENADLDFQTFGDRGRNGGQQQGPEYTQTTAQADDAQGGDAAPTAQTPAPPWRRAARYPHLKGETMIDATTASTLSTANTSAAATSSAELQESYNSFLTLLTAQISNQDPLNPVDLTQFVSQLAQLTQVEQSIATNASLEQISTMLSTVGAMSDLQLIGRDVLVPSTQVRMTEDEFPLSYQLNAGAEEVTVRIFSEDGTLIREMPGPPPPKGR